MQNTGGASAGGISGIIRTQRLGRSRYSGAMSGLLLSLLLGLWAPATAPDTTELSYQRAYTTTRTVPVIQKCLIGELSSMGEQTIMQMGDGAILMIRDGQGEPLLIEIAPPKVTITTHSTADVRTRVQRCV